MLGIPFSLLREKILLLLPPLTAKLNCKAVDEIVMRIKEMGEPSEKFFTEEYSGKVDYLFIIERSLQVIKSYEKIIEEEQKKFALFSELYFKADNEEKKKELLIERIKAEVENKKRQKGDIEALSRYFGYDVASERYRRKVLKYEVIIEVCIHIIGGASRELLQESKTDEEKINIAIYLLKKVGLEKFLMQKAKIERRWQARVAAFQALHTILSALLDDKRGDLIDISTAREIARFCSDPKEHLWIQIASLKLLVESDSNESFAILERRLLETYTPPSDDFIFRKNVVDIIGEKYRNIKGFNLLKQLLSKGEKSEYVRMAIVKALGLFDSYESFKLLEQLTVYKSGKADESPRVRAQGAIAWRQIGLRMKNIHLAFRPETGWAVSMLTQMLLSDPHPTTIRITIEELVELCRGFYEMSRNSPIENPSTPIIKALQEFIKKETTPPSMATLASKAIEEILNIFEPDRQRIVSVISNSVKNLYEGEKTEIDISELPDDEELIGRVMASLTTSNFGLYLAKNKKKYIIRRGDIWKRRLWRIINEIIYHAPNKRQGFCHTIGRVFEDSVIRAHPEGMAEVTKTQVPGERLYHEQEGGWGRYLPLVDDYINWDIFQNNSIRLFSSQGITTIQSNCTPFRRFINQLKLTFNYRKLNDLRNLALSTPEEKEKRLYLKIMEEEYDIETTFTPYVTYLYGEATSCYHENLSKIFGNKLLNLISKTSNFGALGILTKFINDNLYYFITPTENSIGSLAIFIFSLSFLFFYKALKAKLEIDRHRRNIPLVIGGWGTRGKSGTERLKAALFHGLGYEVFVKTTGCEAMFIHSVPEQAPLEVFIFRPYDKATIWEQRDMLKLGSMLKTQVFLWECMALNPKYVELLQHYWMKDDLSTLTNTYPDHEDIQGPAGVNVARVITEFMPCNTTAFTAEDQMWPILEEASRKKKTKLIGVQFRDHALLAEDLLKRFPYQEHPRNIALVLQLSRHLGIPDEVALVEMADNVVPDLGVLKAYPEVVYKGRRMIFVNGHSANERAGFLNNWFRMEFHKHDPEINIDEWIVTMVNNRADRVARSQVFANILVNDVSSNLHFLIGTNIKGLIGYIKGDLEEKIKTITLIDKEEIKEGNYEDKTIARFDRIMKNLKVPLIKKSNILKQTEIMLHGVGFSDELVKEIIDSSELDRTVTSILESSQVGTNGYSEAKSIIDSNLNLNKFKEILTNSLKNNLKGKVDDELIDEFIEDIPKFLYRNLSISLASLSFRNELNASLKRKEFIEDNSKIDNLNEKFRNFYKELFELSITPIYNVGATGDQIIDTVARNTPPGFLVRIMGSQNIKGTGLDWVYRWVSIDKIFKDLEKLKSANEKEKQKLLQLFENYSDYGIIDITKVVENLKAIKEDHTEMTKWGGLENLLSGVIRNLEKKMQAKKNAIKEVTVNVGLFSQICTKIERLIDYQDSVNRRKLATQIIDDLVNERITHERAAIEMRELNKRQKGGWLEKSLRKKIANLKELYRNQ